MGYSERIQHINELLQELTDEVQALSQEAGIVTNQATIPKPDMGVPGHLKDLVKTLKEHQEGRKEDGTQSTP